MRHALFNRRRQGLADFGKDGPSVSVTTGPAATGSTTVASTAVADRTVHAASSWWADTLTLPWALFHEPFVDHAASPPWRLFRMNFYRYDYPSQVSASRTSRTVQYRFSTVQPYQLASDLLCGFDAFS